MTSSQPDDHPKIVTSTHLNDVEIGGSGSAHVDGDGFDKGAAGKVLDFLRHSGAEEERLPLAFEVRKDGSDVFLESHVDHTIRLVQAEVSERRISFCPHNGC